jgi:diguanylate cyclase (GGDEF)-like protein
MRGKQLQTGNDAGDANDLRDALPEGSVVVFEEVSAAQALPGSACHLAHYDSLTDLPNGILFSQQLTGAIAAARREQRKLAVLFVDLDRFRTINDSCGRATGDRLLQSVAQRLLACVRDCDIVSRDGGNEFAILFASVAYAQDTVVAERVLLTLREPHRIEPHELHVTASIGLATYPDDGIDAESLLESAGLAMRKAKESGGNNHQCFVPTMRGRALVRRSPPVDADAICRWLSAPAVDRPEPPHSVHPQ